MQDQERARAPGSAGAPARNSNVGSVTPPAGEPPGVWHTRGYLPHFDQSKRIQMVTYRLADSLPYKVVEKLQRELAQEKHPDLQTERRKKIEALLDAGHGACSLRKPAVAAVVADAWQYHHTRQYFLHAWVIMPNHVHVLFEAIAQDSLATVIQAWKSVSARRINKLLGRRGQFWQAEYWDRVIRDQRHYEDALEYIRQNPVKAGLVNHREQWVWSWWAGRGEKK